MKKKIFESKKMKKNEDVKLMKICGKFHFCDEQKCFRDCKNVLPAKAYQR